MRRILVKGSYERTTFTISLNHSYHMDVTLKLHFHPFILQICLPSPPLYLFLSSSRVRRSNQIDFQGNPIGNCFTVIEWIWWKRWKAVFGGMLHFTRHTQRKNGNTRNLWHIELWAYHHFTFRYLFEPFDTMERWKSTMEEEQKILLIFCDVDDNDCWLAFFDSTRPLCVCVCVCGSLSTKYIVISFCFSFTL